MNDEMTCTQCGRSVDAWTLHLQTDELICYKCAYENIRGVIWKAVHELGDGVIKKEISIRHTSEFDVCISVYKVSLDLLKDNPLTGGRIAEQTYWKESK